MKRPKRNIKNKQKNAGTTSTSGNTSFNGGEDDRSKKPFVERVGDWVCIRCKNLNFSFRVMCNRCQILKSESETLYSHYMNNLLNYVKVNELMQNQIIGSQPGAYTGNLTNGLVNNNNYNINNNFYNNVGANSVSLGNVNTLNMNNMNESTRPRSGDMSYNKSLGNNRFPGNKFSDNLNGYDK